MTNFLQLIKCIFTGHDWKYYSQTLGGDWIRCDKCHTFEEFLPGVHEPKGYHG